MTKPSVSIVVVSRGRPDALARCLLGVSQLQFDPFEVVVVADPEGVKAAEGMAFADHLKLHSFDEANISAARNLGVTHAAGEIVAFIDDDAVPEPMWLQHLVAPAARADVGAIGGFVRGRNGISFQWRARTLDAMGDAHHLDVDLMQATVLTPPLGKAIKTEGTNMAFRRSVLIALGGFDPAFHYFLDETDLNMRLARTGHATAIAPLAEVHHGFAANKLRTQARVPRDLFDIGASWAVFQRKHVPEADHKEQWERLRLGERQRLLRHMTQGGLEPRDVRHLLKRLDQGYVEGGERPLSNAGLATHPASAFLRFPSVPRQHEVVVVKPWSAQRDMAEAAKRVAAGAIVTAHDFSMTALFHQLRFTRYGIWHQKGGVFGRSDRKGRLFQFTTRAARSRKELLRVAQQRGLHNNAVIGPKNLSKRRD